MQRSKDILWVLGLFVLTVILRLPFITREFYHLDVAQFSLGMLRYDVALHMPHPPGYFFLVQVGKIIYFFVHDANLAFVLQAVVFSGLAVSLMYLLVREMKDRRTGVFAALILATNPLFWGMGETGYSYAAGAFIGVLAGYLSYRVYTGKASARWLLLGGFVLGLSGGFRPSDVFWVAPLWLFSVWIPRKSWRDLSWGLISLAAGIIVWFVPTMVLGHAWKASGSLVIKWLHYAGFLTSLKRYLIMNTAKMVVANGWCVAGAAILLPLVFKRGLEWGFFAMWVLPGVLFQSIIGYGNVGHCLFYAVAYPGLLALAASRARAWKYLAVLLNVLVFFVWPHLPSENMVKFSINYISPFYQNIRARDATVGNTLEFIRDNPDKGLVCVRDQREAGEYLWGVSASVLRWEFPDRPVLRVVLQPGGIRTVWHRGVNTIERPDTPPDSVLIVVARGNMRTLELLKGIPMRRIGDSYLGRAAWSDVVRLGLADANAPPR